MANNNNKNVQVAVRIRPLVVSEISKGCKEILEVFPQFQQIRVRGDNDKAFTYNYVFDTTTTQEDVYSTAVKNLIPNLFTGYNLTILAYGQTGSGKTHSMGTSYNGTGEMGIIPRAVEELFNFIDNNMDSYDFNVSVSFMELYQETLYDLLSDKQRDQCTLDIREDGNKGILIPGLTEIKVNNSSDVFLNLAKGSLGRTTASTNMNSQSSRSHAIFTINISMQSKVETNENKSAKFHLVDLAGSERPKKTGAVGNTFKEGVNINKGLLVLGNVISALGDEKGQHSYIPYRDSNLTRLLKDSLGGNSITLMIACVSPADYNYEETLSTLRYADRARKIQNKPIVNQNSKAAEIIELKKTIQQLRLQLMGGDSCNPGELDALQREILQLKTKLRDITIQFSNLLNEKTGLLEKIIILQNSNEKLYKKLNDLKENFNITIDNLSIGIDENDIKKIKENINKLENMKEEFIDFDREKLNTENEIGKHEILQHTTNNNENCDPQTENEQEIYTTKQMALNVELQEITKSLALKEQLAKEIIKNTQYIVDYDALAENQAKISRLKKEKDELLQQLKNIQNNEVTNKIAEQRRKRVQELESQLHDLNKKVNEQARLIKIKEKDEQKIKSLNMEILQMKQAKVKLIRTMREEAEKFRIWKQERDRELTKLKQQDRKKQNQIVKMEVMHNKQQNVLKRKVEEAVALNKRLKEALALRKQAHESKNGKVERTGNLIKQELDIFVHLVEAETALAGLLEDRAILQQQLEAIKSSSNPDENEIRTIEDDIELRSVQIQDLQQKLLDSDEEARSKTRFDCIQSMGEAKHALKVLFEQTADIKKKEVVASQKLIEMQAQQTETNEKLTQALNKIKQMENEFTETTTEIQKENEERMGVLLRQLRGVEVKTNDSELRSRCLIQQDKIHEQEEKINDLQQQLDEYKEKMKEYNVKLEYIQQLSNLRWPEMYCKNYLQNRPNMEMVDFEESFDDKQKDPDWSKTPLAKWLTRQRTKMRSDVSKTKLFSDNEGMKISDNTIKRSSEGGCACTKNCKGRCGCKRLNNYCSSSCKCSEDLCTNRSGKVLNNKSENEDLENSEKNSFEEFQFPIPVKVRRK